MTTLKSELIVFQPYMSLSLPYLMLKAFLFRSSLAETEFSREMSLCTVLILPLAPLAPLLNGQWTRMGPLSSVSAPDLHASQRSVLSSLSTIYLINFHVQDLA